MCAIAACRRGRSTRTSCGNHREMTQPVLLILRAILHVVENLIELPLWNTLEVQTMVHVEVVPLSAAFSPRLGDPTDS